MFISDKQKGGLRCKRRGVQIVGRFPFCGMEEEICDKEKEWTRREVEMKLESKNGDKFEFRKVE